MQERANLSASRALMRPKNSPRPSYRAKGRLTQKEYGSLQAAAISEAQSLTGMLRDALKVYIRTNSPLQEKKE